MFLPCEVQATFKQKKSMCQATLLLLLLLLLLKDLEGMDFVGSPSSTPRLELTKTGVEHG